MYIYVKENVHAAHSEKDMCPLTELREFAGQPEAKAHSCDVMFWCTFQ